MLFVKDINHLPKITSNLFAPTQYTNSDQIVRCCVYGYLRECDDNYGPAGSIRYIGEGNKDRPAGRHANVRVPDSQYIVILKDNLSKTESVNLESILIEHYGRISAGDGVLENVKPASGWGTAGKTYTKGKCKYCESPVGLNAKRKHERSCIKNPSRKQQKNKTVYQVCKFCEKICVSNNIKTHESVCKLNPYKSIHANQGLTYKRSHCQHCNNLFGQNIVLRHERICNQNPESEDHILKGSSYGVINCQHCNKEIGKNAIKKHERSCHQNLNRVNGYGKGSIMPKTTCEHCGLTGGINRMNAYHHNKCKLNPVNQKT